MSFKKEPFVFLFMLLLQACGSKNVTLTLLPGITNTPPKNLMKEITEIESSRAIDYGANFCNQPNVLAGAFYENGSDSSELVQAIRPGLITNFYDAGAGTTFASLIAAMKNPSHTRFTQAIELNVPTGREISVGMIGLFKLGDPTNLTDCAYSSGAAIYKYATFSGSLKIIPNSSMTVNLPLLVAPNKSALVLDAGYLDSPLPLNSPKARNEFVMIWVKTPKNGCVTGSHLITDLTLKLDPESGNSGGTEMEIELEKNLPYGALQVAIPDSTPAPGATGSFTGYLLPQASKFEFTINYKLLTAGPCSTLDSTQLSKTITCIKPSGRTHMATADNTTDGINTFLVDFESPTPVCTAP